MKTYFASRFNGSEWVSVDGTLSFPLGFANNLDEQLDEAYLTIYGSKEKQFARIELWRIVIVSNESPIELFYCLANDESIEYPTGSSTYKHNIYLLEPTKLLEGIYCQTLTFTNELGYSIDGLTKKAEAGYSYSPVTPGGALLVLSLKPILNKIYATPITGGTQITVLTAGAIALQLTATDGVHEWISEGIPSGLESNLQPKIYINNKEASAGLYTISGNTTIEYDLTVSFRSVDDPDDAYALYKVNIIYKILSPNEFFATAPYTVAEMVIRCLEQAKPIKKGDTPDITLRGAGYSNGVGSSVYYNPGSIAEKLSGIIGDEITLTQNNLREQLRSIGGLIHAEPRLLVYYRGESEPPYLEVTFDDYGSSETIDLTETSYVHCDLSENINEYCTDVRSYAANLVNANRYDGVSIQDPYYNKFKTVRSENVNVRIEEQTAYASTDYPIYRVNKVRVKVLNASEVIETIDVTPLVLESAAYNLKSDYGDTFPDAKNCFLYYSQGEKGIKGLNFKRVQTNSFDVTGRKYAISKIFELITGEDIDGYIDDSGFANIAFNIEYVPIYSASFSHSKGVYTPSALSYEQVYTQSENIINARNYGEHLKGVAARLGNEEIHRTYIFREYSDIPSVGKKAVISGEDKLTPYYITKTQTEVSPFFFKTTISMSKDFNRISQYIGIDSHKRIYEVSEREAYERSVLVKQKLVLTTDASTTSDIADSILFENNGPEALRMIRSVFTPGNYKPITVAAVNTYADNDKSTNGYYLNLPVVASSFGNAIVFSMRFKDNYSAGVKAEYFQESSVSGYWGIDVPYRDAQGRFKTIDVNLYDRILVDKSTPYSLPVNNYKNEYSAPMGFKDLYIDADSRETLDLNFEIELLSGEKGVYIGSGFSSAHPLVTASRTANARLYLFTGAQKMRAFQRDILDLFSLEEIESGAESGSNWQSIDISECFDVQNGKIVFIPPASLSSVLAEIQGDISWAIAVPPYIHTDNYSSVNGILTKKIKRGGDVIFCSNSVSPNNTFYIIPKK